MVPDRWKIKDIGGLLHSAIGINITERDCYRFLKIYLNLSLREIMIKHKDFVVSSRKRAYSMYLDPLLKEIDLRNTEPVSKDSKYIKSMLSIDGFRESWRNACPRTFYLGRIESDPFRFSKPACEPKPTQRLGLLCTRGLSPLRMQAPPWQALRLLR